jgi:hypothetical protein
MDFEVVSEIIEIEIIAADKGIRDRARLRKQYGKGRWRKLKGVARVRLPNGRIRLAEIHW